MITFAGLFTWSKTNANTTAFLACPHGSALGFTSSLAPRATFTCDDDGQWSNLNVSQCHYQNDVTSDLQQYSLVSISHAHVKAFNVEFFMQIRVFNYKHKSLIV